MKILVTGGVGYLGSHVVERLKANDVVVYDNLLYDAEYLKPVRFVRGDIRDMEHLRPYLVWADVVIWLAAIVGDAACQIAGAAAMQINTEAVAQLAKHYDGPIIFTSSCSTYGIGQGVCDEQAPLDPQSIYAESKIQAEKVLEHSEALVLRLGTLHGISDRMRFDLAVNGMTMRAVTRGKIEVFGGEQYRPFVAVQDVAEFIARQVWRPWPAGIYNLASENVRIADLGKLIKQEIPSTEVSIVGSQFEDKRNYRVDCAKVKALGFEPKRTVCDTIHDIERVLREGRLVDPNAPRYSNERALRTVTL